MPTVHSPHQSLTYSLIASGLQKSYGDTHALDGFDLRVAAGSIHGLLGPNGAGKSTAVSALCTLIDVDDGSATVAGLDIRSSGKQVRERIGLVGQAAALDDILGGRQNLVMFGRLFGLRSSAARARADELLHQFGLTDAAERPVSTYSGGMRRRLDIAASLIRTPAVLFLDEPTTGLDPRGRNEVWRAVRQIAESGTTVLLTTQHLDEADQLADRISVMNHGRVIAEGTPKQLKRRLGGGRIEVMLEDGTRLTEAARLLGEALGTTAVVDDYSRTVTLEVPPGGTGLMSVVRVLDGAALTADDIALRRPTLDEVFLALTDMPPAASVADSSPDSADRTAESADNKETP
ncbi:daunorubicin/doxorubicin resistance ABC transporter ATP-binding protein DrrA [Glaciibacter superstes]|uniref:daunorubicin/doxorubicin resistance ABC transporter ATP-binding protein DrrA n=1 Tax=Glaciibacter superstes TaxID=501023 RepID=UPI0003B7698D|nr:daunorubicin/doxorubicin resistance ABC transporter ATP-binding protein DrrA [Glaciibacter superstes]